jgi:hypothetical protein
MTGWFVEEGCRPNPSEFADLLLIVLARFLPQTSFKNSLFIAELNMISSSEQP